MGKSLSQKNGNDKIMTPLYLCKKIINHFKPEGKILEPCAGSRNFLIVYETMSMDVDWYEIDRGRDFIQAKGHWDWIITNPPYSQYRAFLNKSMEVADNIVFLQLINATFYKARLRDMFDNGFHINEILFIDTPKEFPQFGFQMGCVYYKRGFGNSCRIGA